MSIKENKEFIRHYVYVVWNAHDLEKAKHIWEVTKQSITFNNS